MEPIFSKRGLTLCFEKCQAHMRKHCDWSLQCSVLFQKLEVELILELLRVE